ncbi:MAG: polysaccharide deacetylase 2 family uncharacterized protein YibQ [Alphaproteobacteria bacterium]|jgi:polysaccharide deacetylase 2 family uncharacterized protein YibQ
MSVGKITKLNVVTVCLVALMAFACKASAFTAAIENLPKSKSTSYSYKNTHSKQKLQLAIIIDDIGAKASDAKAFSLSRNITFSILPHTDYSTQFSYWASQQNREVMLHMPMESLHKENLGPFPLLANMYPKEVKSALLNALKTVPHAVGVNNHMGSKLTQMTLQMTILMNELKANNLFFVDSRTTRFTKARFIAKQQGVKVASRHVFLDHVQTPDFLAHQFALAIKRARQHKKAILIAHPYPVTLKFLQKKLSNLPDDIELITVSEYLQETDKFRINPRLAMNSSVSAVEESSIKAAPQD